MFGQLRHHRTYYYKEAVGGSGGLGSYYYHRPYIGIGVSILISLFGR